MILAFFLFGLEVGVSKCLSSSSSSSSCSSSTSTSSSSKMQTNNRLHKVGFGYKFPSSVIWWNIKSQPDLLRSIAHYSGEQFYKHLMDKFPLGFHLWQCMEASIRLIHQTRESLCKVAPAHSHHFGNRYGFLNPRLSWIGEDGSNRHVHMVLPLECD